MNKQCYSQFGTHLFLKNIVKGYLKYQDIPIHILIIIKVICGKGDVAQTQDTISY